ncbi:MAG: penicillin-binding protein 1C [candidate division WOR-3 bacterium]
MGRKRLAGWLLLAVAAVLVQLLGAGLALYLAIPPSPALVRGDKLAALVVTDRNGVVLREVRSAEYGVSYWAGLDRISPWFLEAVLAAEDRRFYYHCGIDLPALARAVLANLRAGRVVSGGSTITQQLARSVYPARRRNILAKVVEMLQAIRLELHLSKREILEAYVNRVWFGNQVYGVDAAARLYFDRTPDRLSLAQSCFLAAVVRSPAEYDPYRRFRRARERQRWILAAMLEQGRIGGLEYEAALAESIVPAVPRNRFRAPHFVDMVLAAKSKAQGSRLKAGTVRTTLDWCVQQQCEDLVEAQLNRLVDYHVTNAAVVVLDRRTGDVVAMVGSRDYFSPDAGQVNACLSPRQPGSAVKPFVYALAFEQGLAPASIVSDLPGYFSELAGDYMPRNYDRAFHGPVSCRTALGSSYNVPAVRLAEQVGPARLLDVLRRCGITSLERDAGYYGLALALGTGDVSLLELTNAYRVLANCGEYSPVRTTFETGSETTSSRRRVFSPQAAFLVTDILCDNEARAPSFGSFSCLCLPFACAVKTGTSKDFRDNWTIGYTQDYVVGVWVGNFDGSPMHRVSGVSGAGPLFRDVMLTVQREEPAGFSEPAGIVRRPVCPKSGQIPGRFCSGTVIELFASGDEPCETCAVHRVLRVNPETGELASACQPGVERVFEVYPAEYWSWMADNGMPLPPASPEESRFQESELSDRPSVLFPDEDDVFKIDPDVSRDCQAVLLKGLVPPGTVEAAWILDGQELARVQAPFTLFWNLVPGRHRLQLAAGTKVSQEVSFLVLP